MRACSCGPRQSSLNDKLPGVGLLGQSHPGAVQVVACAGPVRPLGLGGSRGPLIRPDGIRRGPRPGERFPNIEVRTGRGSTRLYRVLGRGRHVLLVLGDEIRQAVESSGLARYAEIVDADLRPAPRPGKDAPAVFALVRPDGVLVARRARRDTHKVTDYLRQISAPEASQPAGLAQISGAVGSR
jgi:hypothetical protein